MHNNSTHPPAPWQEDILGPDFYATTLDLGTDPDGEGEISSTLVAYRPDTPGFANRRALLWVHGMTDYFFAAHVARHFHARGYAFYALDLRKCGRSRRPGQSWHYVSDLQFYYADLNAALEAIPNPAVVPIAHSTGGLICTLWLADARPTRVPGLILNGPWLDMMGVPRPVYRVLAPLFKLTARVYPRLPFPGGNLTAFGESIHSSCSGEWDYDLALKPLGGHKKYVGWLAAIISGFDRIHAGSIHLQLPYLTICSTKSLLSQPYCPATNFADAVVDVQQTMHWAPQLGKQGTLVPIAGARHEAFLSREPIRTQVFAAVDNWLDSYYPADFT